MQKGLFINTEKAVCSIHESGLMVFNCICHSASYTLDYMELKHSNPVIPAGYDFYLFNYHFSTTSWIDTKSIRQIHGLKGTIILEMLPNDPFVYCSPFDFDFYCVLDPSMTFKHKKVFVFPRPLDEYKGELATQNNTIPVIGSFGFATKGKGFEHVIEAVNKEFDSAIVRINIPHGTYTDPSHQYATDLAARCISLAKKGIDVQVTHLFMRKNELIYWCSQNTLNCFLYDRNMPGLAATTDQAITSERPLSISANDTFRHVRKYLPAYPEWSLHQSIAVSAPIVKQMKADWSRQSFLLLFEKMLAKLTAQKKLPILQAVPVKLLPPRGNVFSHRWRKYSLRLTRFYYKSLLYAAFH